MVKQAQVMWAVAVAPNRVTCGEIATLIDGKQQNISTVVNDCWREGYLSRRQRQSNSPGEDPYEYGINLERVFSGTESVGDPAPSNYALPTAAELREMRDTCDLTLAEVARQIGYTRQAISRVENGHSAPGREMIQKLLRLYEVEWPE